MIKSILTKRDGDWETHNHSHLVQLEETIQILLSLSSGRVGAEDFNTNLINLRIRTTDLTNLVSRIRQIPSNDIDQNALTTLIVDVVAALRELKRYHTNRPIFDAADKVYVDNILETLTQAVGEVPSLHEASSKGEKDLVELLLKSGAKVDAADNVGWQPLHHASKNGRIEVVELLIKSGAQVEAGCTTGWQSLHIAAGNGHQETVELLIRLGAKVNATDNQGNQPLHEAAAKGHLKVAEFLLNNGALVNAPDQYGWRPLHLAAMHGSKKMVDLLLDRGADLNAAGRDGKKAVEFAQLYAQNEIVELLTEVEQTRKRIEPLLNVYRKQGYLTRFLDKKQFPIDKCYINLTIVDQESFEDVERQTRHQNLLSSRDKLFNKSKRVELSGLFDGNPHLYIEGAAGSGKTTLCRYLVSTWASLSPENRLEILGPWANQYEAVIWLPLREIRSLSESATLREFVLERYPGLVFDKVDPTKTLYILDGFDEIASLEETCRTSRLDKRWNIVEVLIEQPHWLITSRPNLFSERFYSCRRLQNGGFKEDNIKAYIVRFCEDFKIASDGIEKAILLNEDLKVLAHIPLYLELVCSLWRENSSLVSSRTNFTTLYEKIAVLLFRRHLMRLDVNTSGLDYDEILIHEFVVPYRECLESIAFDSKKSGGNRIVREIYFPLLKHITIEKRAAFGKVLFEELGLLTPVGEPKELFDQIYSFIHPTFEEYFAARNMIARLGSSATELSSQVADWLKANCLSKSLEKLIDFAAALASSEKELNTLAEGLLAGKRPENDAPNAWQRPLHRSAQLGLIKLLRFLIQKGAKVDTAYEGGSRPLHWAAWNGQKEVVELLIEKGAKVDTADNVGRQPLHMAAQNGQKEVVELLIEKGAKVGAFDNCGWQPLHKSALYGQKEVVELLIEKGAKVDAANKDGQQPLHSAASYNLKEVAELLIEKGAKVDAVNKHGQQPLHRAASYGHKEVVKLLLEKGAKVDANDKFGQQPLHRAASNGHREVVEFLIEKEAKVDASDECGRQPLHWASWKGHKEVVKLLLEKEAKVDAVDKSGQQPQHLATQNDHEEVVELLKRSKNYALQPNFPENYT